jgi:hypothetical protein
MYKEFCIGNLMKIDMNEIRYLAIGYKKLGVI